MRRWILAVLVCVLGCVSGCSMNEKVIDRYPLGTAYVAFAGHTLALELPFDLRAPQNDAELTYSAQRQLTRFGSNAHFLVLVEADEATHRSLEQRREETLNMYRDDSLKEVDVKESKAMVAGDAATRFDVRYRQLMKQGKEVSLTSTILLWEHAGTVWRVLYQYPTDDKDGQDLAALLVGKIEWK